MSDWAQDACSIRDRRRGREMEREGERQREMERKGESQREMEREGEGMRERKSYGGGERERERERESERKRKGLRNKGNTLIDYYTAPQNVPKRFEWASPAFGGLIFLYIRRPL